MISRSCLSGKGERPALSGQLSAKRFRFASINGDADTTFLGSRVAQISSKSTRFIKRTFPTVFFAILGFVVCAGLVDALGKQQPEKLPLLIGPPLVMAVFVYVVFRRFVFDLVDEVWDCGDSILVRNRGREFRFSFADFRDVYYDGRAKPARLTLFLHQRSDIGTMVVLVPVTPYWLVSAEPSLVRELAGRIDAAQWPNVTRVVCP